MVRREGNIWTLLLVLQFVGPTDVEIDLSFEIRENFEEGLREALAEHEFGQSKGLNRTKLKLMYDN